MLSMAFCSRPLTFQNDQNFSSAKYQIRHGRLEILCINRTEWGARWRQWQRSASNKEGHMRAGYSQRGMGEGGTPTWMEGGLNDAGNVNALYIQFCSNQTHCISLIFSNFLTDLFVSEIRWYCLRKEMKCISQAGIWHDLNYICISWLGPMRRVPILRQSWEMTGWFGPFLISLAGFD